MLVRWEVKEKPGGRRWISVGKRNGRRLWKKKESDPRESVAINGHGVCAIFYIRHVNQHAEIGAAVHSVETSCTG
jgi:hypothetical protein